METNHLIPKQKIKAKLRLKRGTIAVGAIAIILMFIMAISCIAIIVMEYNSYSRSVAETTQTDAMKAKENLLIQASTSTESTTVTATNEGSTPSMIVAVLTLNPSDNSISYYSLPQPITCTVLGEDTFSINQLIQENFQVGVLTSLGNVFWKTQLQPVPEPPPQNWLIGWQYRKSHTINPTAGAGTGYQIKITVYYGAGTDNGANVYLNGHSRTDFADVRFTASDCISPLSYWLENFVDSNYAVFWLRINDDLSTNPVTVYMYYGNSSATTTSNGAATFLMFRDIVADLQTQFGSAPLTTYSNTQDPGDGFTTSSSIDGAYASPCLWFRYWGGKRYQSYTGTSPYIYVQGFVQAGNYGTGGIDVRFRADAAPTGWQRSNAIGADTTVNRKHIIVLDYNVVGGSSLNYYSTWTPDNYDDFPRGTIAASYSLTATSRTLQEFTYSGSIAHTLIGHQSNGDSITLYHEYYAIAKYAGSEPSQGTWGPETLP
jgi:hypothetical protein